MAPGPAAVSAPVPQDLEAERYVLGAVLQEPERLDQARRLSADDFYHAAHGQVFQAFLQLSAAGDPIEPQSVVAELKRHGGALKASDLLQMVEVATIPANVGHYVELVTEFAVKRQLIGVSRQLEEAAHNGVAPAELLDRTNAALQALRARSAAAQDLVMAAEVTPTAVNWIWPGWLPKGKLVIVDGDPGRGKSIIDCDLAASITNGRPFPDGHRMEAPGCYVIANAEDGLADTIVPRLIAAGAALERVVIIDRPLSLPDELGVLEQAIRRAGGGQDVVLSLDPLAAFLSGKVDTFKDHDVRRALAPLAELADRTGAVIKLTRHLSKRVDLGAMYRGGGSIGIIGAARVGMLVAEDPDEPGVQVVACIKSNLARKPPSLRYRVTQADNGAAGLEWLGESKHSADQLVMAQAEPPGGRAVEVLQQVLADGPVSARMAYTLCEAEGVTGGTLDRAKKKLRVVAAKAGFTHGWYWYLPGQREAFDELCADADASRARANGVVDIGNLRGSSSEGHHFTKGTEEPRRAPKSTTKHLPARAREDDDYEASLDLLAAVDPEVEEDDGEVGDGGLAQPEPVSPTSARAVQPGREVDPDE